MTSGLKRACLNFRVSDPLQQEQTTMNFGQVRLWHLEKE
jgi:hypothetical protein